MGLSEELKRAFESLRMTSAGGRNAEVENVFLSVDLPPDLDSIMAEQKADVQMDKKQEKKLQDTIQSVDEFKRGNVGSIGKMSSEQFGNIRQMATNPFSFITHTMLRKFKSGAGLLFIAAIATEVAKFLILELFKPGRIFDVRFREAIDRQIIQFLDRKEQQELRQGFKSVITTTIGGLRGDSLRGQLGGNFYSGGQFNAGVALAYDPSRITPANFNRIDNRKKSFQNVGAAAARGRR